MHGWDVCSKHGKHGGLVSHTHFDTYGPPIKRPPRSEVDANAEETRPAREVRTVRVWGWVGVRAGSG